MVKLSNKKWLLLFPVICLTSCGYAVNYLVEGDTYNSAEFSKNFYRHWDSELVNASSGLDVTLSEDKYITKFADLEKLDPYMIAKKYYSADEYGADYKMNSVNEMFNYGYQSKLFDGQVQCLGYYQLARVQTDYEGFSMRFSKEGNDLDYFAMQFKATTDNTVDCYKVNSLEKSTGDRDIFHNSELDLTVSFYTKNNENKIVKNSFTGHIVVDNKNTNNGSYYIFYAFSLKEYNLSRLVGMSFTYTFEDELIDWNKQKGIDIDYSLMLYEVFLPYTSWQ